MKANEQHREEDAAVLLPNLPKPDAAPARPLTVKDGPPVDFSIRKVVEVLPCGQRVTREKCGPFTL